jgi:hypothetical protein
MDIVTWLRGLGLERYAEAFRANEVTAEALPELTDSDLRELGLPLGPRRVLLRRSEISPAHHQQPTPASQLGHRPGPMPKRLCQDQRPSAVSSP